MPTVTARVAALILVLAFAWAASFKLLRWPRWQSALAGYALPVALERAARTMVPLAELASVVLLITGRLRAGASLGLVLLAVFSIAIVRARGLRGDRLPCGCFGGNRDRKYSVMLGRNAALAALAIAALAAPTDAIVLEGIALPTAREALPAALVVAGLGLAAWIATQVASSFKGREQG